MVWICVLQVQWTLPGYFLRFDHLESQFPQTCKGFMVDPIAETVKLLICILALLISANVKTHVSQYESFKLSAVDILILNVLFTSLLAFYTAF